MERSTQMDREPTPRNQQAATQTWPPLREYQEELKAQLAEQNHNNIMGQLREQAAGREADLK